MILYIFKNIFKLLGLIPVKWYTNGAIGYLITSMSFYSVGMWENDWVDRLFGLFDKSTIIEFILFFLAYYFLFYILIDGLLRVLFHKVMKKRVYKFLRGEYSESKLTLMRDLVDIRTRVTNGMNLPFELGYFKRSEMEPIALEPISALEKEEAIIEVFRMINKWACICCHAAIASIFLFQFNWILLSIAAAIIIFIVPFIGAVLVLLVENLEALPVIQRRISKPVTS